MRGRTKPCAVSHPWLSHLKHDVAGGLVSAAIAIPLAMGFGMFAFVSLGDEYFADGARAGLIAALVGGVVLTVLGDRTANVYAPRITTTFFLGALLYQLVHSNAEILRSGSLSLTLLVFFAIVLLGGVFQFLFGLTRFGTLIRYTPHPVMAGFQNMAAVLLFLVQLGNVCGLDKTVGFTALPAHLDEVRPLSVLVAAATFLTMWQARKLLPRVPPLLTALAVGTMLYFALIAFGLGGYLGPVIGTSGAPISPMPVRNFGDLTHSGKLTEILPLIFGGAIALAIIASIDALLCAKLVTPAGGQKIEGNHLLMRLGIGNLASACFGGITNGFNIGASLVNKSFGARTPVSVLTNAVILLLAATLLFPLVTYMPRAVLSAAIMVIAVQHIDPWSLQLVRRAVAPATRNRWLIVLELMVVAVVAALSIAINIVAAVFLGVGIAVLLFVLRMSRSNIRRAYRCDSIRSRKARTRDEAALLETRGGTILIMELQGPLFFGSAETLSNAIDVALMRDTRVLILDLRRVTEIDSTAARIIVDIQAGLTRRGQAFALAVSRDSEPLQQLDEFGMLDDDHLDHIFEDVDRAIEWAEDGLLQDALRTSGPVQDIPLADVAILANFNPAEIDTLSRYITRATHPAGSLVFSQGDPGRELFIITRGTASAHLAQDNGATIRLVTFAPGTIFGELAILDGAPRSATIVADTDLSSYVLRADAFVALSHEHPPIAIKLLASLGRELSARLRQANRTIHQLES
jgi:SulP family sulfate permease